MRRPRSVDIGGDATGAIIITGDESPVVVYRGGAQVFALSPLTAPMPMPAGAGPAALLMAGHELVEFVGREEFRREARHWLAMDRRRAAQLVVGRGGLGKTRLALQVARDAAADGWQVLLARHRFDGGLIEPDDPPPPVPLPAKPSGVLVVVDYADRWPPEDLLELLTRREASSGRVRMLLLGRSDAFWSPFGQMLSRAGIAVSRYRLPPLEDDEPARCRMFDAAARAFARTLQVPLDQPPDRPELSASGFELTLAVHIAALICVLRHRDQRANQPMVNEPALADPAALTRELLIREVHHWDTMARRTSDPTRLSARQMARAVLIATLTRGLPAPAALQLLPALPVGADPQVILDAHARCYPPARSDAMLEPLYPDRLGEDFVAALLPGQPPDEHHSAPLDFLRDPTSSHILGTLLHQTNALAPVSISTLTVLIEVARRWPHVADHHLLPALQTSVDVLLNCGGTTIERVATISAIAPVLPHLGQTLERIIGSGIHLRLGAGAAAVQEQVVRLARNQHNPAALAPALLILANRLAAVGRSAEALTHAQEAADLYRELATDNRDDYLPNLAMSINNLANRLAEAGRRAEALTHAQEAADLYRELATDNRDDYLPNLATFVYNLSNRLADAGRRTEALANAQEAVNLRRELAADNRDDYLPNLAGSLNNFAVHLAKAGRHAEALTHAQQAADLYRELATDNRDAYLPHLAGSVNNLANRIAAVGRHAEALTHAQQAADLYRELATDNRDAYLPHLAGSVNNLAIHLAKAGRRAEALTHAQQAAGFHRELAADNRDAYLPALGLSVNTLANRLAEAGRRAKALTHAQEAVDLYRELTADNRDAYLPHLAMSVNTLANRLAETGQRADALAHAQEAVGLYRELTAETPAVFTEPLEQAQRLMQLLAGSEV